MDMKKNLDSKEWLRLKVAVPSAKLARYWDALSIAENCNAVQIERPTLTSELAPVRTISDEEAVAFGSSVLTAVAVQMWENIKRRSEWRPEVAHKSLEVLNKVGESLYQQWGSEATRMTTEALARMSTQIDAAVRQRMSDYTVGKPPKWVSDVWEPMQEPPLWKKCWRVGYRSVLPKALDAYGLFLVLEPFLQASRLLPAE
ncbi:hypothetical protein GNI_052100 [Gregarina niphandrodes]|uniref:Uncharacterized protein n=1 Tax=Gregarina niphandrodes TaxID=110365 RepID=A0A023B991_GRENI|nr:hypothetical protein GNI_052100 [Gregarina niphandrodes]EZG71892.1 hypothetical protein GNI_052100 [Gregarina niphandrodes]|eukprot:XP_011129802.1 hypothetical protein GNI_052100 [Gregarina niphandrodes]